MIVKKSFCTFSSWFLTRHFLISWFIVHKYQFSSVFTLNIVIVLWSLTYIYIIHYPFLHLIGVNIFKVWIQLRLQGKIECWEWIKSLSNMNSNWSNSFIYTQRKRKKNGNGTSFFEFSPPFVLRDPRYHHAGIAAAAVETEEHDDLLFPPPLSVFVGVGAVQTTPNLTKKILYSH